MSSQVRYQVEEKTRVARVTLDNPSRRNALNRALVSQLRAALQEADRDARVRVVTLDAEGPDFCAGADLNEVQASVSDGILASLGDAESLGDLFVQLRRMEKPVVAVVHGRALAGGCGLATACDLVVASEEASFGYPEVRLGFVPAMVMAILRRSVGEKRAFELIALGEIIPAEEARLLGLINRVLPAAGFREAASSFVQQLAGQSATALTLSKRLLYHIDGASFEDAIRSGAEVNALARLTPDCQAGIQRFLES